MQWCDEKKESAWRGIRKIEKEGNDEKIVTIKENKETKNAKKKKTEGATQIKEKNDKKKNL